MQNQDNDENDFDDDIYDEVLDDNFEDEFDADYSDIEAEGMEEGLDAYDDFDSEEDWDSDEENDFIDGEAAGAQKKKRRIDISFNKIAISGALIIGVGVLIFQVTTKKPIVSMDTFTSMIGSKGVTDELLFKEETLDENVNSGDEVEGEKGFLYDSDILDSMEIKDTPPMPSTIAQEVIPVEKIEPLGEFEKLNEQPVQIPRPPEDTKNIDLEFANLVNEPIEPTQTTAAEKFLENKIAKPVEKPEIEAPLIEKPAEKIEPKIEVEKAAVVEVEPEPSIQEPLQPANQSVEINNDISEKLNLIVSRLDEMETKINQIKETGDIRIEDISENLDSLKEQIQSVNTTQSKKIEAVKVAPAKTTKVAPKKKITSTTTKRPIAKAVSWELRAAQPGKAWVSKKGQKDMQPVVIGDTLDGVGRITNISYVGGKWLVQGTSGQIKQ